jgi:hypothetical protein
MRWRSIIGVITAALLILSGGMHSIMGWRALEYRLSTGGAPQDLIAGIHLGWQFGGVSMMVFGIIAAVVFAQRLRGNAVSTMPVAIIGVLYILFGGWAIVSSANPFFLIFLIPGALLLLASR